MPDPAPIRETFRPPGQFGRPIGVTPAADLRAAVKRVVDRWNQAIPRNHVRVLNQVRYTELTIALADWTADEICAAIDVYSRQVWNRQKGAWCTFDHFIGDKLTTWAEKALEASERPAAAHEPVVDTAKVQSESAKLLDAIRRLEQMPPAERDRREQLALAEIRKHHSPGYRPAEYEIKRMAGVMLANEEGAQ